MVHRLNALKNQLNMNIRNVSACILIFASTLTLFNCCKSSKSNSDEEMSKKYEIDPRALNVHPEDLSVLLALQSDTLYRALEDSLIQYKGFTPKEAEMTIQALIDERSLAKPFISYFDEDGRQYMEPPYKYFKKYMDIVKDSLRGKEVKLDSTNFPLPKNKLDE